MTEKALKKLEDQLNCPVCLDTYTDPKLLQCHHVYCQKCLVRLVFRDQQGQLVVTCPNCRRATPVPANGVAGLQSAFHINHLLEIQDSFKKVGTADVEEVVAGADSGVPKSLAFCRCPEHVDEELKLYCESCGELICLKCAIKTGKHHSHNYELLEVAFERYKREIESSLQPMEKKLSTVNEALAELDSRREAVTSQQAAIEANIHDSIDCLHKMLDIRRTKLIQDLHQITQRKLKSLAVQRDQVETAQAQLSSCLHFMRERLNTSSQRAVLTAETDLVKQVRELTTAFHPGSFKPGTKADITFSFANEIVSMCESYGQVSVQGLPDPRKCHVVVSGFNETKVDATSSLVVRLVNFKGQPHLDPVKFNCELVSDITRAKATVYVERLDQSRYAVSYQPTVKGRHQLHIRVEGQHIRGSPFDVVAKAPSVQKLGAPILSIDGLGAPRGVAVNQRGEVVVTEASCVTVFSPSGAKLRSFGTLGSHRGQFDYPYGVTVDDEGNILVADHNNHRIQKFTADGKFLAAAGGKGSGSLQFKFPYDLAFNRANKKIYVLDYCDRVQILNSDLTFCHAFGKHGSKKGQFNTPVALTCDAEGKVYVADTYNNRIQVFTAEGEFLKKFGHPERLYLPSGVAVDASGLVYVSLNERCSVSVFSCKGQLVTWFGRKGPGPGEFRGPGGVAVDGGGVLHVADRCNCNVQVF